jgi:hypothetical protein
MEGESNVATGEANSIQLGINLGISIALSGFYPLMIYLVWFAIFFMEGRFAYYWPTVSETATEYPNWKIAAPGLLTVGLCGFHVLYIVYWYLLTTTPTSSLMRHIFPPIVIFTEASVAAVGFFPVNERAPLNFLMAFFYFGGSMVCEVFALITSLQNASLSKTLLRIALIVVQPLSLGAAAISEHLVCNRLQITLSAAGEYVYALAMPSFYMSFATEVGDMEAVLVNL